VIRSRGATNGEAGVLMRSTAESITPLRRTLLPLPWSWALALLCAVGMMFFAGPDARAQSRTLTVFYEGTDHELHVYRVWGKQPGKTLLLIGGIQGDEPGGFLSADHYADFSLAKGNLIVVPRANFQSIVLQRRKINEDMNRKFAEDEHENYETKIVRILKKLIQESDCLLNLHDGSGFYADRWISEDRNPRRFGQSIIADSESYTPPEGGKALPLGEIARSVCNTINRRIDDPSHHFHFNNHRTREAQSLNKEQRKSATYYALYTAGIPAFGVETSKSLPLEAKVRHHNLAINAFMEWLDIVPETPGLNLDPPEMRYIVISVNDSLPMAVQNDQVLQVKKGDHIRISHIEANYERGLSADVLGAGTVNDFRRKVRIDRSTRIVVRKDYIPCGSIYLEIGASDLPAMALSSRSEAGPAMLLFRVRTNGREQIFPNGGRVEVFRGDLLQIVDVIAGSVDPGTLTVNFKGYVGNERRNTGEDRGYVIDTAGDLWPRYSLDHDGKIYQIVVSQQDRKVGALTVDIGEPELRYIVVRQGDGPLLCLPPGHVVHLGRDLPLQLVDIRSNLAEGAPVKAYLTRAGEDRRPFPLHQTIRIRERLPGADRIDLFHNQLNIGSIPLAGPVSAAEPRSGGGAQVHAGQIPAVPERIGDDS
ncbi:MAG: M14/M99 family metallopeptidase, partial [Desulfobacterales bacterium]